MTTESYKIVLAVEAEAPMLAREKAIRLLSERITWRHLDVHDFSLSYLEPVRASSEDGNALLKEMWITYLRQNVADTAVLMTHLMPHAESEEPPLEVLDDWEFRAACYRIGHIGGWPIRIYDDTGVGINNSNMLQHIIDHDTEDTQVWVVQVEVL